MYNITLFVGTAHENSYTRKVADFIKETAEKTGELVVTLIDPRDMNINLNDEAMGDKFPELKKTVNDADGFLIVAPEYNHGYPAGLKFLLDLNLKEYSHKPVALVGVSSGPFGGTRVIEAMVPVVKELGMVVTSTDLQVSGVKKIFETDQMADREKWEERANKMLKELIWMTKALKSARDTQPTE